MSRDLLYSKEVYSLSKEIIEPAAQAGVAAYNKGKEINNSILEAEKKRRKKRQNKVKLL